ncbi:MAG: succinylglutamate-semialdehyde dehydrogenase [Litorimonas sp.]
MTQIIKSICPATGDVVWEGAAASAAEVHTAVAKARKAFADWSLTSFDHRAQIAQKYADAVREKSETIALAISRDMGKPLWEARTEAGAMANKVAVSIQSYEERTPTRITDTTQLKHRPHGVMAVFGPFNFPGHLPNGHIIPSLLAGNTVVFKPSELTPQVAEVMARCWAEAGLPAGVLNIVQGARDTGAALLDADIDGLLFTGSAATGTFFHKHFAGRPEIMLALEMGGNNPLIIQEPVDVDAASDLAFMSGFITAGQRCTCARRLVLPTGKFGDAVVDALQAKIAAVKIGRWDIDDIFMGPVVSTGAAEAAKKFEADLIARGGTSLTALDRDGAFLRPGLIDVTGVDVPDEELFAPFLQIIRTPDLDAAIAVSNATRFGLASGLICDDEMTWNYTQPRLRAGIVNWNKPTTGAASTLPFGGPGLSGNHRPAAYYAADYCAWPQAGQVSERAVGPAMRGFK